MVETAKVVGWWELQKLAHERGEEIFHRTVEKVCNIETALTDEAYAKAIVDATVSVLSLAMCHDITIFDVRVRDSVNCDDGVLAGLALFSRYLDGNAMDSGLPGITVMLEGLSHLANRSHFNLLSALKSELS
jgi:hypothetical protein